MYRSEDGSYSSGSPLSFKRVQVTENLAIPCRPRGGSVRTPTAYRNMLNLSPIRNPKVLTPNNQLNLILLTSDPAPFQLVIAGFLHENISPIFPYAFHHFVWFLVPVFTADCLWHDLWLYCRDPHHQKKPPPALSSFIPRKERGNESPVSPKRMDREKKTKERKEKKKKEREFLSSLFSLYFLSLHISLSKKSPTIFSHYNFLS